jgi:hypothetical protein
MNLICGLFQAPSPQGQGNAVSSAEPSPRRSQRKKLRFNALTLQRFNGFNKGFDF